MLKKYKILYQEDGVIKSFKISTNNINKEQLPQNIIEIKNIGFDFSFLKTNKIKDNELINIFYELSLMLNSKILLDEAIDILIKNQKTQLIKEFLKNLKKSFSNSLDFDKSINDFNINPLIKSFFKIIQESGNPKENIASLNEIITKNHEIKKEFIKSMTYPIILCITFFLSLIGIFKFVVPNFESIFRNTNYELSFPTKLLLTSKDIFENYFYLILIVFSLIFFTLRFLYKKNKKFRYKIDSYLLKKLFIISSLYKFKTFYIYFIVVDILLKSKYDFIDSISKAKVLINNQCLLDKMTQIENLIKSGKSISFAFESVELFDDVTLNLLRSGEVSNSLETVIYEIKNIYKRRFEDKLKLFSLLIEPLFFIIIMALIVWIILAIFVPLWSMNDMLN